MKKRLSSRRGVTLTEMLIAVAILAIFVTTAAVGTSALFGTGEQMMAASKAAVLGSDVMDVITNELRFGEDFTGGGTSLTFSSASYGEGCTMRIEDGELVISKPSDAGTDPAEEKIYRPIGEVAYREVTVGSLDFRIDAGTITVSVEIVGTNGQSLWKNDASIVPFYTKVTA